MVDISKKNIYFYAEFTRTGEIQIRKENHNLIQYRSNKKYPLTRDEPCLI